jgi:hypothetical protein
MTDLSQHIRPLLDWLSQGQTQNSYCKNNGLWDADLTNFIARTPNLADEVLKARALGAVAEVDRMVDIAARTDLHPGVQRNQIDVHKWRASKFLPKVFGDKLDLTVTEKLDISGALIDARKRRPQPLRNHAQAAIVQDTEYTTITLPTHTDKQSDALPVSGQDDDSASDPFA